jgi:hypothetical protein
MELDRLRLTETALMCLRDEEIPQRIGFVSDKIFEPSPWRRWWAAFWGSAARLGFASAAMLSVALVVFSMNRPAPTVRVPAPVTAISDTEIRWRVDAGVERAVADIEARYSQRTEQLVKDIQRRDLDERSNIQKVADMQVDYWQHRAQGSESSKVLAGYSQGEPK